MASVASGRLRRRYSLARPGVGVTAASTLVNVLLVGILAVVWVYRDRLLTGTKQASFFPPTW